MSIPSSAELVRGVAPTLDLSVFTADRFADSAPRAEMMVI